MENRRILSGHSSSLSKKWLTGSAPGSWKPGSKTENQWRSTFAEYVFPRIGRKPVDKISAGDVLLFLTPLALEKPETARKLRTRLGLVFKWAMGQGFRHDNPAGESITGAFCWAPWQAEALLYGGVSGDGAP